MQLITARINLALTIQNTSLVTGGLVQQRKSKERELKHYTNVIKGFVDGGVKFDKNGFIDTKVKFLAYDFKKHNSSYFDNTNNKFGISLLLRACDNDTSILLKQSLHLIMIWLIALCNRQCNKSSMESLALPSHIDEWLDSIKNAEIGYKAKKTLCGDTGERRVSSILSGLLYRWLEARCSEWQAELARDELLQSMDMEEPGVSPKGECKSRKKKKKKGSPSRVDQDVETLVESKDRSGVEAGEDEAVIYPLVAEGILNELASNTELSSPSSVKAEEGVFVANEHTSKQNMSSPINTHRELQSSANQDVTQESVEVASFETDGVNAEQDEISSVSSNKNESTQEQIARKVQVILATNKAIYNRIRGHMESSTNNKTIFIKNDYAVVDAHHDEVTSMFQFITYPEDYQMEFDTSPLSNLPFSLDVGGFVFYPIYLGKADSCELSFVDFEHVLGSLVMLHSDIQPPMLVKLKNHLELVQNCLIRIDDWLSTPSSNTRYLQQCFGGEKLKITNKMIKHFCIEGSHSGDEKCLQCESCLNEHKVEKREVRGGRHRRLCSDPEDTDLPYFMCSRCDEDETKCPYYKVEYSCILQKFNCSMSMSGNLDVTFDISEEQGRVQLNKFIGFIESVATK